MNEGKIICNNKESKYFTNVGNAHTCDYFQNIDNIPFKFCSNCKFHLTEKEIAF